MRLITAFLSDIRFQWRHRFYFVYMLVCSVYLLLLHSIPTTFKEMATLLLTLSDPGALGLIFAGGIILLEKDQGIHDSLFVTPIRLREYLLAKAISLSLLSMLAAWIIHGFSLGVPASPFQFTVGVLLTSSLFTFLSIGVAVRTQSVNGFILLSQLYALPLTLPLLDLFGVGPRALYWAFPTYGSVLLFSSINRHVTALETIYAAAILTLGNAAVFLWAQQSFKRHILMDSAKGTWKR